MGRSYQAEQLIQQHFDGLLARKAGPQVGLLLGKQAVGARDLLLNFVQTPLKAGGSDAVQVAAASAASSVKGTGKKGTTQTSASSSGAASAVVIDVEWVQQHATQVARMLPGGLCLVGCYLFGSEPAYQSAAPQLCDILQALREMLPPGAGAELVLIHADAGSRKVTARSSTASSSSSLSPAELKWAPCLPNLMILSCRWPLQCMLPAPTTTSSLLQQVQQLQDEACQHVRSGVAFLSDGTVPADDVLLVDLPAASASSKPDSLSELQLQLLPVQGDAKDATEATETTNMSTSQQSSTSVCGHGSIHGWLHGCAVVHKRQSWLLAVQELKNDLCASLATRVELLEEDALSWQEEQQTGSATGADPTHPLMDKTNLGKPYTSALAQRVQLTGLLGTIPVFDHLLPGEGTADAAARGAELLAAHNAELDTNHLAQQVTTLEAEASTSIKLQPWNPLSPPAAAAAAAPARTQQASSKGGSNVDCSMMMLSSAAAGGVAAVATAVMYMMGWFK